MTETKNQQLLKKNSKRMMVFLTIEYLLGMYVNMFAAAPDDPAFATEGILPKIIFGLHGLVGTGLLIGAIVTLMVGIKSQEAKIKKTAVLAFSSVAMAFLAGIATIVLKDNAAEVSSYIMSVGFISALIFYGKLLHLLSFSFKPQT
jgi:hypothetical protein